VTNFIEQQTNPLLLAARFLDQDGDGVISKEDIKLILSKQRNPDLIFNSLHNWTAISVKEAVSQKPFLLKAIANNMTAVLLEKQVTFSRFDQNKTCTEAEKPVRCAAAIQVSQTLGTTCKRSCPVPQANRSPPC
jgi:Ca2+-binding EF-hand superfamily protein